MVALDADLSLDVGACACRLKIDSTPFVYPIPRLSDWLEIKSFPNIIPEHADSWENDEVMYNMEIADTDGTRTIGCGLTDRPLTERMREQ